jgi:hypothetical protein
MTHPSASMPPPVPKKRRKWPWVVVAGFVALCVIGRLAGSDTKDSAETAPTAGPPASTFAASSAPQTPTTEAAPEPVTEAPFKPVAVRADAPSVIPLPVTFAEDKSGLRLDTIDLGQHVVGGVDHERAVFDKGNWRVVAQCQQSVDGVLKVGVIKNDELQSIQAAGQGRPIADNSLSNLLDCP